MVNGDGNLHLEISQSYASVGIAYGIMQNYTTALTFAHKSLEELKAIYGDDIDHPKIKAICTVLSFIYTNIAHSALRYM